MISVIMPLYNKAPYVEKAIRSVLAQTYDNYELIIVNDGSTDDSLSVAKRLVDSVQCENICIIDQTNSGVATARNNGVAEAKGDYISFLDADDWWDKEYLAHMVELIANYPEAGIYGCGYYTVKNGRNRIAKIGVNSEFESGIINYCKVYAKTLAMPLWTGTVIIKQSVFNEFNGFKSYIKLGEDFDLWIRVALKYPVAFLNKQLAYYNQDVDLKNRAVGKLHSPKTHMLWNLDYLSEEESKNPDYKYLIDRLRVYGLHPYYLYDRYRSLAQQELVKIDWSLFPKSEWRKYNSAIWLERGRMRFMRFGSKIKQYILKRI